MIRPAEKRDIGAIVTLARHWYEYAELPAFGLVFDPATVAHHAANSIDQDLAFVSEKAAELTGCCLGLMAPWLGNANQLVLQELIWWMEPEHRTGTDGVRLFFALEKEAKSRKLGILRSVMKKSNTNVRKFYKKQGYTAFQMEFYKEY